MRATNDDLAQLRALAHELDALRRARAARQRGSRTPASVVVSVRLDADTLAALDEHALAEGSANRAAAVRTAIRHWIRAV